MGAKKNPATLYIKETKRFFRPMIRAMKVLIAKGGCPSLPPPTKT